MFLLFIIILNCILPPVLGRVFGDYYCVNEGFFPRSNDNEFMNYTSELKSSSKGNYDDKKLFGTFYFKQRVTKIGVYTEVTKKSGQMWLKALNGAEIDDVCTVMDNMKNFMTCFSGKLNIPDCSLEKGLYKLENWSLEEDLKARIDKMFYGQYKFSFTLRGFVEGKKEKQDLLPIELMMTADDLDFKPQPSKVLSTEKKSKQSGGKSDKKNKKNLN